MKGMARLFRVFAIVLLFCGSAVADEFHYSSVLIGDRASGMGGAYTAISDDATGLYYNPAGIVYSSGKNLSASVNAYYNLTKTYKGAIAGHDWVRNSAALLPNYFGVIQPLGKIRFGFSYAVPDTINEDQNQTFTGLPNNISQFIINFRNEDNTYNYGPSFAAELAKDFSAGLTLYVHQRKAQHILNQIVIKTTGTPTGDEWMNDNFELKEWGLKPVLGLAWSPIEKVSLGFSLSKTLVLSSRAIEMFTCSDPTGIGTNCPGEDLARREGYDDRKRKYPLRTAFGMAYFASSSLLLSGDLTYYTKVTDPIFGDKEPVLNLALGTEYYLDKNWAMRAGLYTNMANTPDIVAGETSIEEHVDLYGGTLSISHFTRNSSVTLGGGITAGSGKSQITGGTSVQDASTFGWMISLSSSYSY